MTPSPTDIQERETIARIIDPEAWEEYLLEDGRVDQEVASIFQDAYETSLAKADQVLALRSSPQPGSEGWSDDAIERAAKAICDFYWNGTQPWPHKPESFLETYRGMARASLAASPTPPTAQPGEVERLRAALGEAAAALTVCVERMIDGMPSQNQIVDAEYAAARARAALTPSESGEAGPQWTCTRCGRDEIDARANGCTRGPCPMVPR